MSTSCPIGRYVLGEHCHRWVRYIYCRFDGYPEYVGQPLADHYTRASKVDRLLDLGDLKARGVSPTERPSGRMPTRNEEGYYERCKTLLPVQGFNTTVHFRRFILSARSSGIGYSYLFNGVGWNCYHTNLGMRPELEEMGMEPDFEE